MSKRRIVGAPPAPKKQATPVKPKPKPAAAKPEPAPPARATSPKERGQIKVLIDEVRKDPAADAPRQVLADVLEQRGDPRGQLIQLQIRRAGLPWWDPQASALELQERAILAEHDQRFRAELPELEDVVWGRFVRGFVGTVVFKRFDAFIEHREACAAATPIHGIMIPWPRSGKAAELDAIAGLRELTMIGTAMRKQDLQWLASSPLLATVRSLTLLDSQLESLLPLLASPRIGELETLAIPLHLLDDGNIYKLTQATLGLTTLDLSTGTPEEGYSSGSGARAPRRTLTNYAAMALAGWRSLAQVRTLDLSSTKLGLRGLTALLKSPHTAALKSLTVRDIADAKWEVDDSLTAFAGRLSATLDELDVSDNDLDSQGAADMGGCSALAELKVLRIERVMSKHFDRLTKAAWFDSLRVLACSEASLPAIVKRAPEQLHTLRVVPDGAQPRELVRRLTSGPLDSVTTLDLSEARLGDDGLKALASAQTLPNVVALALGSPGGKMRFSRAAAEAFAKSAFAEQLTSLETGFADLDRLPAQPRHAVGSGDYKGPRRYL